MALFATLLAGESVAQSSADAAIAVSNGHLAEKAYDDARREVFQSLRILKLVQDWTQLWLVCLHQRISFTLLMKALISD